MDEYTEYEIYENMEHEGGFWMYVDYGGLDFLKGTKYEADIPLLTKAATLANEIYQYYEEIWEEHNEDGEEEEEDE